MAHIICKYDLPGCVYLGNYPEETDYNEWCGEERKGECPEYRPKGKVKERARLMNKELDFEFNDKRCNNFVWRHHEIESTVKNYEYCEDMNSGKAGLKIKGRFIFITYIRYLEIDGKVLIGTKEGNNHAEN